MEKEKLIEVSNSLLELYEETQTQMQKLSTMYLLQNAQSPNAWTAFQRSKIGEFNEALQSIIKLQLNKINDEYKNALTKSFEIVEKESKEEQKETADKRMKNISIDNAIMLIGLASAMSSMHKKNITTIEKRYRNASKEDTTRNQDERMKPLPITNKLFDVIVETTENYGGVDNVPKVTYSNGRQMQWSSYMDMRTRTTLNTESSSYQLEVGGNAGTCFWLCSYHGDCAPDHADYQGKVYFDERYTTYGLKEEILAQIDNYISSNNLLSIQSVRDGEPYLTTRPNCRHYFEPVDYHELIDEKKSADKLLQENNMLFNGDYEKKKYQALEQQRKNERDIREIKRQIDFNKEILKNAPTNERATIRENLNIHEKALRNAFKRQTTLIKANDYLYRERRREQLGTIKTDLGLKALS